MSLLRIAAAAVNQTPLDWDGNFDRLAQCLTDARAQDASLACLPELAITGYGCEDQFLAPDTCDRALAQLEKLLPLTKNLVVAVGLPLRHHNAIYNVVAVLADGALLGFYAKQNLAGDGIHYEPRWFRPWPIDVTAEVRLWGTLFPIGDLVFDIGGVKIAFEICEDAWVADRPGVNYTETGVDLILNPSASHFAFGKTDVREQFVREGSRAFGVAYVYANLLGNEAGRILYDGGCLIASGGSVVAAGPRLTLNETEITVADVDLEINRLAQSRTAGRELDPGDLDLVRIEHNWPQQPLPSPAIRLSHLAKEEEFTLAVTLGLFDYLRKSHSSGFVVSLSGGADSAAVASLVYLLHQRVTAALGADRLPPMDDFLLCVYQATENSGDVTEHAARTLAEALGAEFASWDVQAAVDHYTALTEATIGRKLSWEADDIPLQNIQARVRAPGIWMQANLRNALLLATSNRSEAAVGYTTMDGDTCGGLSPIGGIDKAFLRQWLRWLETEGSDAITKIPALAAVNRQQPTAELRPAEQGQTDEDDLMPYPVLDQIEKWAIRDKKSPGEIFRRLPHQFPDYDQATHRHWVIRFFQLWSRNQWKRERYAPSFHLDDENLDPKTWCRFPILSSSFETELRELADAAEGKGQR